MPKFRFEGTISTCYSGEVEADSLDEAREIINSEMDWYNDYQRYTEIDWIDEVGAE